MTLDGRALPDATPFAPPQPPPTEVAPSTEVVSLDLQAGQYVLIQDDGGQTVGWLTRDAAGNDWFGVMSGDTPVSVRLADTLPGDAANTDSSQPPNNIPPLIPPKVDEQGRPVVGDPPGSNLPPGPPGGPPPPPPPPGPDPRGAVIGGIGAVPRVTQIGGITITRTPWGNQIQRGNIIIQIHPNGGVYAQHPILGGKWIVPPPGAAAGPQR